MRTFYWILALSALASGCDYVADDDDGDDLTNEESGCPSGFDKPDEASMFVQNFQVNGLAVLMSLDDAMVYDAYGPAACASDDGTRLRVITDAQGEPVARILLEMTAGTGAYDLTDGARGVLEIETFGENAATWANGSGFNNGSWYAAEAGAAGFSVDVQAQGISGGVSLAAQFTIEASGF
jgi:hypothetical protein